MAVRHRIQLTLTPDERLAVRAACRVMHAHLQEDEDPEESMPLIRVYADILKQIDEQEKSERRETVPNQKSKAEKAH